MWLKVALVACLALGGAAANAIWSAMWSVYGQGSPALQGRADVFDVLTRDVASGSLQPLSDQQLADLARLSAHTWAAEQARYAAVIADSKRRYVSVTWTLGEWRRLAGVASDVTQRDDGTAWVSHALWTDLGRPATLVGDTLLINGRQFIVGGILPERFAGLTAASQSGVWVTGDDTESGDVKAVNAWNAFVQAPDDARRQQLAAVGLVTQPRSLAGLASRAATLTASPEAMAWVLVICVVAFGAVVLSGAIIDHRCGEISLRTALGATPRQLGWMVARQSATLSLAGGAFGSLTGYWALRWAETQMFPSLHGLAATPTGVQLLISIGAPTCVCVAASLVKLATLLRSGRVSIRNADRSARNAVGDGRQTMVFVQIALTTALLLATAVAIDRSEAIVRARQAGVPEDVTVLGLSHPSGWLNPSAGRNSYNALLMKLRREKLSTGLVDSTPYGSSFSATFTTPDMKEVEAESRISTTEFFAALGLPLADGRVFDGNDTARSEPVAVINDVFANRAFPSGAVGRTISNGAGEFIRIIGVIRTLNHPVASLPRPQVIRPWSQAYSPRMYLLVRSTDPRTLELVRKQIIGLRVDRELPLRTMVRESLVLERLTAIVLGTASLTAALVAFAGIYVLLLDWVMSRRQEIAVRLVLGASHGSVFRRVFSHAVRIAAIGVAAGVALGWLELRLAQSLVFGIEPPTVWIVGALTVTTIASLLAVAAVPAWRATRFSATSYLSR